MNKGKITLKSLIIFFLLVYVGYYAFLEISSNVEKEQIEKEVTDLLGTIRGAKLTETDAEDAIEKFVLQKKHNISLGENDVLSVTIDSKSERIYFDISYEKILNFIFFTKTKRFDVQGSVGLYE